MSGNCLYHTWFEQIQQLLPDERVTRLRNFVWLMVGIYQSKSVHLGDIASKIPGRAKELSLVRRLSRFLANPAVRVREWYAPVASNLLQSMAQTVGEIRLIADGTMAILGKKFVTWPVRLASQLQARFVGKKGSKSVQSKGCTSCFFVCQCWTASLRRWCYF
ncbi:MAG: hypothetical protein FJY85_12015 [Deltaproteobacteria bacterium]|nr:hypothetical protein [Chloroflexota bacterium]MBM3300669.1 hypothetical protein [Deltaproteobacteria bacterium]